MSGAPSCTKCGNLLAVTSVSGLCPACAPAEPPTASFPAPAGEPNTITLPVAADPPPAADTPNIAADPTPASAAAPAPHAAPDAAATASAPSAPPARPERGQPADPPGYEIVHKIGRGGMGDVYLARETVSRQIVALKFLRDPDAPELLTRFELEFRALREVVHPNVVRVLGHDFQRGEPYFVMEYLEGGSLAEQLKGGPLDPTCAVDLIRKVAGAVQAMHEKAGILHRDIKPGNILLTNEGEPKLADFGLAKFLDAKTVHTLSGGMLGTLRYMPPEQINGKNGALGYPADVYGLGATLYHLLTGHPPFVRDGFDELLFAVLHDAPTDPRTIRSELTRGLSGVVMRCLEKDPRHRYQTVAEFLAALDRWAESETPPPVPPLERLRRWVRRNRVALSACALLALGGAAVAAWPRREAKPVEPLVTIRAELRDAGRAELIGATGRPRHARWLAGTANVLEPTDARPGFAFEAPQPALLELLVEPGTNFAVEGEFQLLYHKAIVNAGAGPKEILFSDAAIFGLYCGRVELNGPNNSKAHFVLVAEYTDYLTAETRAAWPHLTGSTRFVWVAVTAEANGNTNSMPRSASKQHKLPLVDALPAPVRRLRVEVTAEGATAFWAPSPKGALVCVGNRSSTEIANDLAELLKTKPGFQPVGTLVWNPSASCGVFCRGAAISVSKVTVSAIR